MSFQITLMVLSHFYKAKGEITNNRPAVFKDDFFSQSVLKTVINIILDKNKAREKIKLHNAKKTIKKFTQIFEEAEKFWYQDRSITVKKICQNLNLDVKDILKIVDDQLGIILKNKSTWPDHLNEEKVLIFVIQASYWHLYEVILKKNCNDIDKDLWKDKEMMANILYDYSLLFNLMYFRKLAILVSEDPSEAESVINLLLPHFLNKDLESYQTRITMINETEKSGKKKRFGIF